MGYEPFYIPCHTNMVSVRVIINIIIIFFFGGGGAFYFALIFYSLEALLLDKTIIPLPLVGYEIIVVDPADKCEPPTSSSAMRVVSQFIIYKTLIKLK